MTDTKATAVSTSIVVNAPADVAFAVFTEDMGSWWPPDHHILQSALASMVFEPREGGRIYDVGADGSECQWARVLAYEPPDRVVFSWDISLQWQVETDPDRTSEVEVRFIAEEPARTRRRAGAPPIGSARRRLGGHARGGGLAGGLGCRTAALCTARRERRRQVMAWDQTAAALSQGFPREAADGERSRSCNGSTA